MEELKMDELEKIMGEDARDLPQFAHFSWCTTRVKEFCKISVHDLDMIYEGLVVPDNKSVESYLKFFYCLVEYVRLINPFEDWVKTNDSNTWIKYITEAGEYVAEYENDQEKWIDEFKQELSQNPDPVENMLDAEDTTTESYN